MSLAVGGRHAWFRAMWEDCTEVARSVNWLGTCQERHLTCPTLSCLSHVKRPEFDMFDMFDVSATSDISTPRTGGIHEPGYCSVSPLGRSQFWGMVFSLPKTCSWRSSTEKLLKKVLVHATQNPRHTARSEVSSRSSRAFAKREFNQFLMAPSHPLSLLAFQCLVVVSIQNALKVKLLAGDLRAVQN